MPTIREAGKLIQLFKFKALLLDEFIPLVEYYQSEHDPSLGTIKNDEDEFTLSSLIDENLRTIKPSVITTEIRSIWLPFFVKKGCSDSLDKDGIIEIKLSDKSGDIRLVGSNHIRTSFGSKIKVEIDINCKSDIEFFVDFYASDDTKDEKYIGEAKNVHCGRFKIIFTNTISFDKLWSSHPATVPYPDYQPCKNNKNEPAYDNQCAIRMGICLTKAGIDVASFGVVRCDYHPKAQNHILRAEELARWLNKDTKIFGKPIIKYRKEKIRPQDYDGKKGIVFFLNFWGQGNQSDHIDLWNGKEQTAGDNTYFERAEEVWFWPIK